MLIVRSASFPISNESRVSKSCLVLAGIDGSVKLTHVGIFVPAGSPLFKSSFLIFISFNILIVFFALPPAHSLDSR
jgi:hypothetical protein